MEFFISFNNHIHRIDGVNGQIFGSLVRKELLPPLLLLKSFVDYSVQADFAFLECD